MRRIIKFIVKKIPRKYLIKFSFLFSALVSVFYKGNTVECPICENKFRKFLPYGNKGNDNRLCPKCLSLERHRLLWLYLKQETDFFSKKYKMLHLAPEQAFYKRFKKMSNIDYITADLESPLADIKLDIKKMPFKNNEFDIVFCNHVMEHIDDEKKALSEVLRVMKKGGFAILQVPLDYNLEKTFEDLSITNPKEREKLFGQYDHLRLYGKDYPKRLTNAGFKVIENKLIDKFTDYELNRYRLDKREILYIAIK